MADVEKIPKCTIMRTTDKGGVLVQTSDGKEVWIPQSAIHDDSEIWKKGDHGTLIVSAYIAEQKGLVK